MKRLIEKAKARKQKPIQGEDEKDTTTNISKIVIPTDNMLVRNPGGHVTQTITKLKTKIISASQSLTQFIPTSNLRRKRQPIQSKFNASVRKLMHKVSTKSQMAINALASHIQIPQTLAKPLKKLNQLTNQLVFSRLPSFGILDKLKKFVKTIFPSSFGSMRHTDAQRLIENSLRGWIARVKSRFAAKQYKTAIRDVSTHEAMSCLTIATNSILKKLEDARQQSRHCAAKVIQLKWRHVSSKFHLAKTNRIFVINCLRETGRKLLCRCAAQNFTASVVLEAYGRWAVTKLQSRWRGYIYRKKKQEGARAKRRQRENLAQRLKIQRDSPENKQREMLLATCKRIWAREDFVPNLPQRHQHLLSSERRVKLAPLNLKIPPRNTHALRKMSIQKWQRERGHVNPSRCWVAIPIHVQEHRVHSTIAPLRPIEQRHYDLDYDYLPGSILSNPSAPSPTFQEKVQMLEKSGKLKLLTRSTSTSLL